MIGRDAAAGEAVREHRDAQLLGEGEQRALPVTPVEAGAGHDHRPLGVAQERGGSIGVPAAGAGLSPRLGQRGRRRRRIGLAEHVVEREVEERGTGMRGERGPHRLVDQPRDLLGVLRGRGELDQRTDERHVVDLLQRTLAPAKLRRAAAQDEQRRAVLRRRGDRAHPVGHARAGGQRADARRAGHLGPALGGERGRLLVAHVDDVDPLGPAAVVDREQMAAGQREQLGDAVRLEPRGDQPAAVRPRRRLCLGRHGRHANSRPLPQAPAARRSRQRRDALATERRSAPGRFAP